MRWFKHFTDASDDEFISELEEEFGLEGYARWFKLLEVVAKQMDESGKCYAEYSWKKWQTFLRGKRNKLETFLKHLENKSKISWEQNGNLVTVKIPKLLEFRDEYTRKRSNSSGHESGPDSGPQEVEVEGEVDPSESKDSGGSPPSGSDQSEQPSPPPTPMNIWSVGVSLLGEQGVPERKARSFVGKLCKDHGEQAVSEAFGKALYERPADLQGWITKVCQNNGKRPQYTNPNAPDGTLKL